MKANTHGGKRPGAGRKPGSNRYGEPTTRLRVPNSYVPLVATLLERIVERRGGHEGAVIPRPADPPSTLQRPLFGARVPAGFPSPAEDYVEGQLDLNAYFVPHPAATFFVRVSGESMIGAGILPGDILIVDRSLEAVHGAIVIAVIDGELTVKRLYRRAGTVVLQAENPAFAPLALNPERDVMIWGVVSGVTRKL